jgi:cytoskeletal protein RodZ
MKELSEYLKSERLQQGLSLKTISEQAHVSVSMLELLEEGEYDRIGTALLVRNFVRAYCAVLGIDPEPLLAKYAAEIFACDIQDQGIRRHGTVAKTLKRRRKIGVLPVLFLLIVSAAGIYGGTWLWKRYERQSLQQTVNKGVYTEQELPLDLPEKKGPPAQRGSKTTDVVGPEREVPRDAEPLTILRPGPEATPREVRNHEPVTAKSLPPANTPAEVLPEDKPAISSPEAAKKHLLSVEADQKTWIQVKIDDDSTHEVMMQPGDKREWEAEENVQIVVGNAGGVRMRWDGNAVNLAAKPGSVIRFRLPDEKLTGEDGT